MQLHFLSVGAGNPYLPLWEHLPDGEPRVFENPGYGLESANSALRYAYSDSPL
jgi:hypothetical protein